jgi:flavin reductase (DIM6/NTAB) family NADH-FMN oxidoreductase RutF
VSDAPALSGRREEYGVDAHDFFEIMASLPSGVAIVTTSDDTGRPHGLTTTAVCSASAHPPMLLVCLDKTSRTLASVLRRRRFVLHIMATGSEQLCARFASKSANKFDRVLWRTTRSLLPVLQEHVLAWMECSIRTELDVGDHAVLAAAVEDGATPRVDIDPTVYCRRTFHEWSANPIPTV